MHRSLVKEVTKVGEWTGGNLTIALPALAHYGLEAVAFVQAGLGVPSLLRRGYDS